MTGITSQTHSEDLCPLANFLGEHSSIEAIRRCADRIASSDRPIFIVGDTGTGKEALARYVHSLSDRHGGPFLTLNCAGPIQDRLSRISSWIEQARPATSGENETERNGACVKGTLLLNSVEFLSDEGRARVLHWVDELTAECRDGLERRIDLRLLVATTQPVERLHDDLLSRLAGVALSLPPLEQRGDDVLLLADHFLKLFCNEMGRQTPAIENDGRRALLDHSWPGNVRELRNTIERVCLACSGHVIKAHDLVRCGFQVPGAHSLGSLSEATREFQIAHIRRAIESSGGNMTAAANGLNLHRSNLYRKMRQLGMPVTDD